MGCGVPPSYQAIVPPPVSMADVNPAITGLLSTNDEENFEHPPSLYLVRFILPAGQGPAGGPPGRSPLHRHLQQQPARPSSTKRPPLIHQPVNPPAGQPRGSNSSHIATGPSRGARLSGSTYLRESAFLWPVQSRPTPGPDIRGGVQAGNELRKSLRPLDSPIASLRRSRRA